VQEFSVTLKKNEPNTRSKEHFNYLSLIEQIIA
jgi:hypothetical protein